MKLRCWDKHARVWYPEHQWGEGYCARCGRYLPGMTNEAKREVQQQREMKR